MSNQVLITGAGGFVGPHLIEALSESSPGAGIFAWYLGAAAPDIPSANWRAVDVSDPQAVSRAIRDTQPTHLVHLAAVSNIPESFSDPRRTWMINVIGTLNILEAVKRESPQTRVLLVSSSEVYGRAFSIGAPLDEQAPTQPMNPYAASKLAAEVLAGPYRQRGLRVIIARPFNHIGPGQSPEFVVPAFAGQLAEISAGSLPPRISVGNLEARRDFLHVADVARAYCGLLGSFDELAKGSVFNICSGVPRRIGDLLEDLIRLSGLSVTIEPDPSRMRPSDIPIAVGDAGKLREHTGWTPAIDWTRALQECLEDAKQRIRSPSD